jgi:general secretion pathway protein C
VRGPLIEQPDAGPAAPVATGLEDPLTAPDCAGPRVNIVSESNDPMSSMAAVQASGDGKVEVVHVGDRVGDHVVAFIGYNPLRRTPAVWLAQGASICQALLFSPAAGTALPLAAPAVQAAPTPGAASPEAPLGSNESMPAHMQPVNESLASQIRQAKEGEVVVSKGAVAQVLERGEALMPDTRIFPEKQNEQVVGIRIFGIRPETLLGKLGFQSGDRFESINGVAVTSPDEARRAYEGLRNGPLQVQITRRGQPMMVTLRPE